jgi:hypothetical protein
VWCQIVEALPSDECFHLIIRRSTRATVNVCHVMHINEWQKAGFQHMEKSEDDDVTHDPAQSPVGCLGIILRALGIHPASPGVEPLQLPKVMVNKYFITNAEADFFRVLRSVVGDHGHILAQVSLRQLLWFPGNSQSNPGRGTWQNKAAAKSVDFVVCEYATLRPRLVIELDEPSHARPERQSRDEEVQMMLKGAKLPIIRVITSRSYNTRELADTILPYLK